VHLNLPRDVLAGQAEFEPSSAPVNHRNQGVPAPSADAVTEAAALLASASRPVIIAGGGIKNTAGHAAATSLAEAVGCPVVTSPGHGDAIPHGHPLNGGQMGPRGNVVASRMVKEADVIVALGTRLGFNSTFYSYDNVNRDAKIIHIELEPTAIGRFFPIEIGIWADAVQTAELLATAVRTANARALADGWTAEFQAERVQYLADRDSQADESHPTQPSGLFKALRSVIPADAIITMDAGTLCLQATDALEYHTPQSLFTPLDFGLVGFSFACGLGAKLAQPERPVVSLMGDGGFGMTTSELSTAVDNNINTTTIVMNNRCWGAEKAYQRDFFDGRYIGADVSSPPFDKLAELYGAKGFRAETLADVAPAIEAALACDAPAIVDVAVDPDALYSFRRDSFTHRSTLDQ
jgi:acetolactate synthase-1/2/3 large subunit/sulfoacetaldehyde acetyltransferase